MTGIEDYNRPLFARAANKLRAEGHEVFNPGSSNIEWLGRRKILKYDAEKIFDWAEAVALLPGWSYSMGARMEHAIALAIPIEVILLTQDYTEDTI